MKRTRHFGAWLLIALGLLLTGAGLWNTQNAGSTLEYVLPAPQGEGEIAALLKSKDSALEDMADAMEASCVWALKTDVSVSGEMSSSAQTAGLRAGGSGFFAVYPRYLVSGRLLSETELIEGAKKAVLDEELAFKLFPTVDPIGQKISVDGTELEVVGVVYHKRTVGEINLTNVYAPLLAVQDASFDILALSAKPLSGAGASIMFDSLASGNWRSGGETYHLEKEAMRARLPILYLLCISAAALVLRAFMWLNTHALSAFADLRARLKNVYPAQIIPRVALYALIFAAGYGALFLALYWIASRAANPLYIFPEWVPENIVEWSSIRSVFWNLATAEAKLVRCATPVVRKIQFWAGVVQWGVVFTMAGTILRLCKRKR